MKKLRSEIERSDKKGSSHRYRRSSDSQRAILERAREKYAAAEINALCSLESVCGVKSVLG